MEFSDFTLHMTEVCNFNCCYCYQKKGEKSINISLAETALDFFLPLLKDNGQVNFFGGEPLIVFEQIKHIVKYTQNISRGLRKQIRFTISTNGSLLDEDMLNFINENQFKLLLSFDGYTQDICRQDNTFNSTVSILKKILTYPNIELETNSVFTPDTIKHLAKSLEFIMSLNVKKIQISLANTSQWHQPSLLLLKEELNLLQQPLIDTYQTKGVMPFAIYQNEPKQPGMSACFAGRDRITLAPDGRFWGCTFFFDYFNGKKKDKEFNKYCFGDLQSFIKNHEKVYPKILANYTNLRMDSYYTYDKFCIMCDEMKGCSVCPVGAAFATSSIGRIPNWTCEFNRIFRDEKKHFWKQIEN